MAADLWEYRVTVLAGEALDNQAKLNRFGDEGWQLVTVAISPDSHVMLAYLRRRKSAPALSSQPADASDIQ